LQAVFRQRHIQIQKDAGIHSGKWLRLPPRQATVRGTVRDAAQPPASGRDAVHMRSGKL